MKNAVYVAVFAIFIVVIGLIPPPFPSLKGSVSDWQYSHLRTIDPIDAGGTSPDIVALLTRLDHDTLNIRIDFLELLAEQDFDVSIYIDALPGGNELHEYPNFLWDYAISYQDTGMMRLYSQNDIEISYAKLRTLKDYRANNLIITVGRFDNHLDSNASLLILITNPSELAQVSDHVGPILIGGIPPPPIEVSLVFWNVLDSSTPASILKSWAGAHTGPQSSRHGFSYLLNAAEKWNIPLYICNLDDPEVVFALKYLQVLPYANDLHDAGIINTIRSCNIAAFEITATNYSASNQTLDNPSGNIMPGIIMPLLDQYSLFGETHTIIGGDLSDSMLGTPDFVQAIFSFISSHPWIRVVDHSDARIPIVSGQTNFDIPNSMRNELANLPDNIIGRWAEHIYAVIIGSDQANIVQSPGSYLSQLGHFIKAANWVENPQEINTCDEDIDWDGQPECILATNNSFLTFELDGGYLAFAFHINARGVHQIIGPTTQFGVLRSDPSELSPTLGIAGDPGQIVGAFADPISGMKVYHGLPVNLTQLDLVSVDGSIRKSFSVQNNTIHVSLTGGLPDSGQKYQLPLVLDPWLIYSTPLIYRAIPLEEKWMWGADDKINLTISTDTSYHPYAFNDTYYMLGYPEDPNFDYTPGHLLPIPMALVEFLPQPLVTVDLVISP